MKGMKEVTRRNFLFFMFAQLWVLNLFVLFMKINKTSVFLRSSQKLLPLRCSHHQQLQFFFFLNSKPSMKRCTTTYLFITLAQYFILYFYCTFILLSIERTPERSWWLLENGCVGLVSFVIYISGYAVDVLSTRKMFLSSQTLSWIVCAIR